MHTTHFGEYLVCLKNKIKTPQGSFKSNPQVSQTNLDAKTKQSKVVTQTGNCEHPSQFTDELLLEL